MGLRRRFVLAVLACTASGLACASVIGLNDFEIVPGTVDASADAAADAGTTTVDGINITPTTLALPDGNCAGTQSATFTITNAGHAPTSYSATLGVASVFSLQGADGSGLVRGYLEPGASTAVTVLAQGLTTGTSTADVTVTTGTTSVPVHVSYTAHGSSLTIAPASVDFGTVHDNTLSAPINVTFTNTGKDPVSVTGFTGDTADFVAPPPFTVPAGASASEPFSLTAGTAATARGTLTPTTSTPLCSAAPAFTLAGQRTAQDITIGPTTVDLGDVPCGGTATATGTVTITNYGTTSQTINVSSSPHFSVSPGLGGTVPAIDTTTQPQRPGVASVTVTAQGTSGNAQDITEAFSLNVSPSGTNATVQAHLRLVGATLQYDSNITVHAGPPVTIPITNSGNLPVCVTYTLTNEASYFTFPATDTIPPGNATHTVTASYNGPGAGPKAIVKIASVPCPGATAAAAFCQTPKDLQLDGR